MFSVKETTLHDIDVLRMGHLSSLPEFQDIFPELQISHAKVVVPFLPGTGLDMSS